MCKLKSCIVLKDRVFCPDYDSHDRMLEELGIEDTRENAERLFVRVELSPIDGDIFSPVDTWEMITDQDIIPNWWVEEAEKPRVIEAVAGWAKDHIFCDAKNLNFNDGTYHLKNSTATLCGNSSADLWGNSSADLWGNSSAKLWDNSTAMLCGNSRATLCGKSTATLCGKSSADLWGNSSAKLWDNSTAMLCGNSRATLCGKSTATLRGNSSAMLWGKSTATLCGNSRATLWDNSTAMLCGNSSAELWDSSVGIIPDSDLAGKPDNYTAMDNATIKDCKRKVIYQSGDWKFEAVTDEQD